MKKYNLAPEYTLFKEIPFTERPRERIERLGAKAMRDEELLMLIIGSGNSSRAVNEIADDLLKKLDANPDLSREEMYPCS